MNDFRKPILESVIKELGWEIADYQEEQKMIQLTNGVFLFLGDSQRITINVICMELALIAQHLEPLVQTVNAQSAFANYEIKDDYLMAATCIENTIFVRENPADEIKQILEDFMDEVGQVTKIFHAIRVKLTGM